MSGERGGHLATNANALILYNNICQSMTMTKQLRLSKPLRRLTRVTVKRIAVYLQLKQGY